jgi:hypothetical protein
MIVQTFEMRDSGLAERVERSRAARRDLTVDNGRLLKLAEAALRCGDLNAVNRWLDQAEENVRAQIRFVQTSD